MMELWPFTNFHDLNLDWIIKKIKNVETSEANAKASEEAAADSASSASASMGMAMLYRNKAKDYRDEAQGFANDAQDSADSISGVVGQVNANTSRIDNLIANAGDGTIPSELVDIRVAYDGITYTTAGDAVRDTDAQFAAASLFSMMDVEVERGNYEAAGQKGTANTQPGGPRARSVSSIYMQKGDKIVNQGAGGYAVIFSDMDGTTFTDSGWLLTDMGTFTAPYEGMARVTIRRRDGADFDDTELNTMRAAMKCIFQTHNKIYTEPGRLSDAFTIENMDTMETGWSCFDYNLFQAAGVSNNGTLNMYAFFQVATNDIQEFDFPLELVSDTGYEFSVFTFDENDIVISNSGFVTSFTIPAGQRFRLTIRTNPIDANKRYTGVEWMLTRHLKYKTEPYRLITNHLETVGAYMAQGEPLPVTKTTYNVELMPVVSTPVPDVPNVSSYQGMAINNGVIFQLYSNDVVELIDMNTGTQIAMLSITSEHGDTMDFSNEYYDPSDEFPLAYITADTTPAKVYVNRITRTGCTLIRTYTFPSAQTGYYAGHTLDPINKIIYEVGYTNNSYSADPYGTNNLIVSVFDLKSVTDNGNGTYTPAFIRSFKLPFYTTLQGQAFLNGLIACISSHYSDPDTKIIFIDPGKESIVSIMDEFPADIKNAETEALAFIEEGDNIAMVVKPNEPRYFKITY